MYALAPRTELVFIELVYFLLVAGLCALIYLRTRESYQLTLHEGLRYFRNIFLFFGLAYLFRLGFLFLRLGGVRLPRDVLPFVLLLLGFFGTLAVVSVAMTLVHRRGKHAYLWLSVLALVLSFVVFYFASPFALLAVQLAVLVGVVVAAFMTRRKLTFNRATYLLLLLVWLINALLLMPRLVPWLFKVPLYVVSLVVFVSFYVRLRKRLGSGKARSS